ncbi:MAG: response regulator receiver protein [Microgenomates group bacterium Gr01-1014_16]|nr:MAG: response regulator receiver protein [Microgenomates group bacterium Gr01-1014_16]
MLGRAYKAKLDRLGYDVVMAGDGQEALDVLRQFTPDVVLLDLILPKKDGFEVLKEIKANPEWKKVPVLVASNLGQESDVKRAMGLGAVGFVTKTNVTMEDLALSLRSILKD